MMDNLGKLAIIFSALVLASIIFFPIGKKEVFPGSEFAASSMLGNYVLSPEPVVDAHAYIVKILGKGVLLTKRRELKKMLPASLTKLLTAVVTLESIPSYRLVPFSENSKKSEPKLSTALAGEKFFRDDVIRFALIESANDAALALAEVVGQEKFVELMNTKARFLGLKNSSFQNPTGLDQKNHYTSAEDLAYLAEFIWYQYPELWEISRTSETIIFSDLLHEHKVVSTNELLQEFPGILGGKTGFTDEARGTLLFLYPLKTGETVVVVLLRSENRFGDGKKIIQWLENYGG